MDRWVQHHREPTAERHRRIHQYQIMVRIFRTQQSTTNVHVLPFTHSPLRPRTDPPALVPRRQYYPQLEKLPSRAKDLVQTIFMSSKEQQLLASRMRGILSSEKYHQKITLLEPGRGGDRSVGSSMRFWIGWMSLRWGCTMGRR